MTPQQAERALVDYFLWLDRNPDGVTDSLKVTNCFHLLRSVIADDVPGDVVELGCYQGRTSVMLSLTNTALSGGRGMSLYDSFEGLPALSSEDEPTNGQGMYQEGQLAAPMAAVQSMLYNYTGQYPAIWPKCSGVTLHPGWVEDTLHRQLPARISFAYVDLDLYGPIKHALAAMYERLSTGAIVLLDDWDYVRLPGVMQAVGEFLADKPESARRLPCPYQAYFVKL